MKCGQLSKDDLAQAYRNAAQDVSGAEVDMAALVPHLQATGSSCGACPALFTLAKKAFESEDVLTSQIPDIITLIAER